MQHQQYYSIEKMCTTIGIPCSAYYSWKSRTPNREIKQQTRAELKARIKQVFYENKRRYGSNKIQKVLEYQGIKVGRSVVSLMMKEMGLVSKLPNRYKNCTDSKHNVSVRVSWCTLKNA